MNTKPLRFLFIVCLSLFMLACGGENPQPSYTPPDSSFGLMYTKIFQTSCAVNLCHDGSNNGPLLVGENVYSTLLDSSVLNINALQAGLSYVKAGEPDRSFLYTKIDFDSTQFKFGSPMPLGGLSLTNNQIMFVRQWIAAGAPLNGHVADSTLLN
ncbi:MAG: hypothetical protein MRZ79_05890 [Bacteroidia bacterium]|nr:hypothetical protein [Bacteroidia bacterium]